MADEHKHPPGLPEIRDEATDTPMWLPLVGLGLLALIGLLIVYRAATAPEPTPEAPAEEAAPAVAGEPAAEAQPAPAPEPAPAAAPQPGHEGHGHD